MTTEFTLIRHGQTNWNLDHRYQGTSDTPLNETGTLQAAALAADVVGQQIDIMASSPLLRAWHTALPVATALGYPQDDIYPDDRLIERHYGAAEGMTMDERLARFPGDDWEGLESRAELRVRAMTTVEDYLQRYPNQRIALVTHGTWITSVLDFITDGEQGFGKVIILNTSRTWLTHDDAGWHIGDISFVPEGMVRS